MNKHYMYNTFSCVLVNMCTIIHIEYIKGINLSLILYFKDNKTFSQYVSWITVGLVLIKRLPSRLFFYYIYYGLFSSI